MNENTVLVDKFNNSFQGKEHQTFVLYGLGKSSQIILEHFSKYHFLGLMDGFREDGQCFGYPVLSQTEVARLHPDAIVIVARKNSTRIIAKRIEKFCRDEGIALYDIEGHDLLAVSHEVQLDHPYFQKSIEQLWTEIAQHEVVSFDIFDTLLMRRVLSPEDVFALVEQKCGVQGFAKYRQAAERELYRDVGQVTIEDIYQVLGKSLSMDSETRKKLYQCELATESEVLIPRKDMVELLNRAADDGKTVWLISDMYYPADTLRDFLQKNGIVSYDDIFVSCDYGKGKTQGLYRLIQEKSGCATWLHIGDSYEADDTAACMAGLDVFPIKSAFDMAEISSWNHLLELPENLSERVLLGEILAKVFNSPFALHESEGRPVLKDVFAFGNVIFGPVLTGMFGWMMAKCAGKYDALLWGARDGYIFYLMHKTYEKHFPMKRLPQAVYFYTSRMAAMAGYPINRADILYMTNIGFAGSAEELLAMRFGLSKEEILPQAEDESLEDYVLRHEGTILRKAQQVRECFDKYWNSLNIRKEQKLAFFDLVSSGSCHMCAERFLGQEIDGFYLVHILEDFEPKKKLHCNSYLEEGHLMQLKSYLSSNYEPLETMVMSQEPSLLGYSDDGRAVFSKEKRTEADLEYLWKLQAGALNFFEGFCSLWGEATVAVRPQFAEKIYSLLRKKYTRIATKHLSEQTVTDDFTKRDFVMKDMFD